GSPSKLILELFLQLDGIPVHQLLSLTLARSFVRINARLSSLPSLGLHKPFCIFWSIKPRFSDGRVDAIAQRLQRQGDSAARIVGISPHFGIF
ncbi:hypothetical protein J8I82_38105, partial [Cupriavidus sp. LEh25]